MNIDTLRDAAAMDGSKIDVVAELRQIVCRPGLYFGMPAEHYHADASLGSTDLRALHKNPRTWQAYSWMTPEKYRLVYKDTEAKVVGTALHEIVLEGVEVFNRNYVRRPAEYDELSQGEKTAMTKAIKANLKPHQSLLPSHEYDICIRAAQEIVEHEQLRKSLTGGENEVSVFWVDAKTGVPCKARYDRLKAAGIGDIKTIANMFGAPLEVAALGDIKRRRYDLQAIHYMDGRSMLKKFVEDELVVHMDANTPNQAVERVHLCADIRKTPDFAFQFIFLQKSDAEVWSGIYSPNNPTMINAAENRITALTRFVANCKQYGTQRWPATWRLSEIHPEDQGDYGWH